MRAYFQSWGQSGGFPGGELGSADILKLSLINTVISSEARNPKSENGARTTILDSSLRCAAFRMTGWVRGVQNDREEALCLE